MATSPSSASLRADQSTWNSGYPPAPFLFLDVDGVLIACLEDEPTAPVFTPGCVEAFRLILEVVPRLRVVFSSTRRHPRQVNLLLLKNKPRSEHQEARSLNHSGVFLH